MHADTATTTRRFHHHGHADFADELLGLSQVFHQTTAREHRHTGIAQQLSAIDLITHLLNPTRLGADKG